MKIKNRAYRSIWAEDDRSVSVIDQTLLPWQFAEKSLKTVDDAAQAIRQMVVRGAPLIGVTAAYGVALAMAEDSSDQQLDEVHDKLLNTRPTAVNLQWALSRIRDCLRSTPSAQRAEVSWRMAATLADEDVALNSAIGDAGLAIFQALHASKGERLNILTHCNAGWLATVDWGTAISPIYKAHDLGLPVHVWVDETRPRNQGALTAWELQNHGVAHTYIVDNAGGLLMQRGQVDVVIVGCDRVAANGDVCNKVGTYLKALAAAAHRVPFYVALPSPTFDPNLASGSDIPIEERSAQEVSHVVGQSGSTQIVPDGTPVSNLAFDITPAELVTGYLTDRGLLDKEQLSRLVA
ncbi:MAG: methylthioribose-1-phosphate isomerase [Pseudoalteromonas tetraodonis]|jgi:methylthioribose-1-phosphate isomerase